MTLATNRELPAARPARRHTYVAFTVSVPVLDAEYWLARCEGFLVDSFENEELGVVQTVECSPRSGRPETLVVATGWFGRHRFRLCAQDVGVVLPDQRLLLVPDRSLLQPIRGEQAA